MRSTPLDVVQDTVTAGDLHMKLDRDVMFVTRLSSMFSVQVLL